MNIKINETKFELNPNRPEPVIQVDAVELEHRSTGLSIVRIDVENSLGETSRFFINIGTTKTGRPVMKITTRIGAGRCHQVTKSITGSYNII